MENVFFQISILLAITTAFAIFARLLRQPLIIAYIIAGIFGGPLFLNLLSGDKSTYNIFAQFGVALLLFVIGINLNFRHLRSIGLVSLISGVTQVIFTASIGALILLLLNFSLTTSLYLGVAITFSSTIVIMKLLADKKDTETFYGKHVIGLMLVQDIIAVIIVIAIGILKVTQISLTVSLSLFLLKGIAIVFVLAIISIYIIPRLMDSISHSSELLFIFTVAWCFGLASVLYLLGFSIEIGAIAAGIALSSSPYQPEISSRIKPLRDFFLVLFFIVLGSEMSLVSLNSIWLPGLLLSLFILIGNPLILFFIFRLLKFTRRNAFLAGLTAAQVSEFGFVILFAGRQMGYVKGQEVSIFTFVAIITIFVSSYLITFNERIYRFLLPIFKFFGPDKNQQREDIPALYDGWVVGYHRIGKKVSDALREMKMKFAVIDFDPSAISQLRRDKIPFYFGDVADIEFLDCLPIAGGKIIIMTIPSMDDQINLILHARKLNPKIIIIANAYYKNEANELYKAGANYVMMPHLLGGNWIAEILKQKKWRPNDLSDLKKEQESSLI